MESRFWRAVQLKRENYRELAAITPQREFGVFIIGLACFILFLLVYLAPFEAQAILFVAVMWLIVFIFAPLAYLLLRSRKHK